MKQLHAVQLLILSFLAMPLMAQTQIGGGTCSSASLSGPYAVTLSGRQLSTAGAYTSVLLANGAMTFDGLSAVTITLTANTNDTVGTSLNWSGTYSVQANCVAAVTISTGANATLNVMIYDSGNDFVLTGSDATYSYTGNGVTQPSGCSVGTLNGVYTLNASGYALSGNSVNGLLSGAGLLQFDGQGNVTFNSSSVESGGSLSTSTSTGTYSISANCLGSATLTNSNSKTSGVSFAIYSVNPASTNFYVAGGRASAFVLSGVGHTAYGQPAPTSMLQPNLNPIRQRSAREEGL